MDRFLYLIKRLKTITANNASLIKTIYYNYHFLPFNQAKFLPLIVGKRTLIVGTGKLSILDESIADSKIYIGCKALRWLDDSLPTNIVCDGLLELRGNIYIGSGSSIEIGKNATLSLENGFNITGKCTIVCRKGIEFKGDNLLSWDTLIMDTDAHTIINADGKKNNDSKIVIGEHVWISAQSKILAGTILPDNTVVGCGAIVKGRFSDSNILIAGVPAKIVKKNINWNIEAPL